MLRKLVVLAALAAPLLAGAQASGQAAPALPEDPRLPRYREVEHGPFFGFEAGWLTLLKTPTAERSRFPFAPADGGRANLLLIGTQLGYELTDRIALSLVVLTANGSASPSYGAFSLFGVGADARLSLFALRDSQGVQRVYGYVHGRAAWLLTRPAGLFGNHDVLLAGGPGVEWFTRLRHFSIGAAVDVAYVTKAATLGFAVSPTVRYTF